MDFSFDFAGRTSGLSRVRTGPDQYRMLVLGDFSGSEEGSRSANAIFEVDIDNFDTVIARLRPQIHLGDTGETLHISSLEDFHPDRLCRLVPELQSLVEMRKSLGDPAGLQLVARQLGLEPGGPGETGQQPEPREEAEAAMLERLLGAKRGSGTSPLQGHVEQLIRQTVTPFVQHGPDALQQQADQLLQQILSERLRMILRTPGFRAMEALWRGLWSLISNVETGETLSIHICDISKAELGGNGSGSPELESSPLWRRLREHAQGDAGGESWSVLLAAYTFSAELADLKRLAILGATAVQSGALLAGAAGEALLGCRSLEETPDPTDWQIADPQVDRAWSALRRSAFASSIGLLLPRLLLRLPYGVDAEPIETFAFEELDAAGDGSALCWGNPVFGYAQLLARSLDQGAASADEGSSSVLEDLPSYSYARQGESRLMPVAEYFLTEAQLAAIDRRGIMAFASHRRLPVAMLAGSRSIAEG